MNKLKIILLTASIIVANNVYAANIGETATALGNQVSAITNFMVIGATLLGLTFLVIGGVNLKKHGDNPQQVPLAKPLIFLASGTLLFGLGSTSDVMQSTLFGESSKRESGGASGQFSNF